MRPSFRNLGQRSAGARMGRLLWGRLLWGRLPWAGYFEPVTVGRYRRAIMDALPSPDLRFHRRWRFATCVHHRNKCQPE
jgi:hypothetical protein